MDGNDRGFNDTNGQGLDGLEGALDRLVQNLVDIVPEILGALLIIWIGYMIAKAISRALRRFMVGSQLDARLHAGQGGTIIQRAVPSPTNLLEKVAFWLLFLGAVSLGATVLGIDALNDFIGAVYSYIPQAIAALVIFLIGSAIAAGVATLVKNTMGDTPTGKIVETIAPIIVIGITIFAILDQLNIAPTIITITYGALLGSVALGSALAFGLGGQEVASRMLEDSYEKGKVAAARAKADMKVGKERAKQKMNR